MDADASVLPLYCYLIIPTLDKSYFCYASRSNGIHIRFILCNELRINNQRFINCGSFPFAESASVMVLKIWLKQLINFCTFGVYQCAIVIFIVEPSDIDSTSCTLPFQCFLCRLHIVVPNCASQMTPNCNTTTRTLKTLQCHLPIVSDHRCTFCFFPQPPRFLSA